MKCLKSFLKKSGEKLEKYVFLPHFPIFSTFWTKVESFLIQDTISLAHEGYTPGYFLRTATQARRKESSMKPWKLPTWDTCSLSLKRPWRTFANSLAATLFGDLSVEFTFFLMHSFSLVCATSYLELPLATSRYSIFHFG